ncbi:MAG: hypothetical protein J5I65_00335 [Aridibacter famidurans]|nr:hypothetical protein [Aridibacter famidurans]
MRCGERKKKDTRSFIALHFVATVATVALEMNAKVAKIAKAVSARDPFV